MAFSYTTTAINARLQGLANAIDGGGSNGQLLLYQSGTLLVTIPLAIPCGTVNNGVLTFTGGVSANTVLAGDADGAKFSDSTGVLMIIGLTVGIPGSAADVIISNGMNTTHLNLGQTATLLSAQIVGA